MPGGHKAQPMNDPDEMKLWKSIIDSQGHTFTTSGRGKRPGNPFTYTIRGAEMFVDRRAKSITRATILFAYRKVREIEANSGTISGPKAIGVHGDSYIFAIFKAIGVFGNAKCMENSAEQSLKSIMSESATEFIRGSNDCDNDAKGTI